MTETIISSATKEVVLVPASPGPVSYHGHGAAVVLALGVDGRDALEGLF